MRKLFILLILIPFVAPAQTTNTVDIFSEGNCKVSCMETLENDSLVSAFVILDAKDDRLPTLKNYFTLCYDTPQNVFRFITELEKFITDNTSTSAEIGKHKAEIDKTTGTRTAKVFDERGLIFHRFSPKIITGIKTSILGWAGKYNLGLEQVNQ